jgi:hypothetical protein
MTAANLGRLTLATDELVREHPELARELYASLPTGMRDQIEAAARDTASGMRRAAALTGHDLHESVPDDHPDWLRLGMLHTLTVWCAGKARTCLHDPNPRSPQQVFAAAWKPDLIVCGSCQHLLVLPRNSDADRRCDSCGRITEGPDSGDGIYPCLLSAGALTWLFGACLDCRYWAGGDP